MEDEPRTLTKVTVRVPVCGKTLQYTMFSDDTLEQLFANAASDLAREQQQEHAPQLNLAPEAFKLVNVTTYPPQDLGTVRGVFHRTLHALELWPSAIVELVAILGEAEAFTVHLRANHAPDRKSSIRVQCGSTVRELRRAIVDTGMIHPEQETTFRMVCKGRILGDDAAALDDSGVDPGCTVICVRPRNGTLSMPASSSVAIAAAASTPTPRTALEEEQRERGAGEMPTATGLRQRPTSSRNRYRHRRAPVGTEPAPGPEPDPEPEASSPPPPVPSQQPQPQQQHPPFREDAGGGGGGGGGDNDNDGDNDGGDDDEPMCRICHEGADVGALFSPCQCSGSMRFVHVECLDVWRRMSSNERSYFQCDACGYQYRIERTRIAVLLKSDYGVGAITALGLIATLNIIAAVAHLAVPGAWIQGMVPHLWYPRLPHRPPFAQPQALAAVWDGARPHLQRYLDFLLPGVYVQGGMGFAHYVRVDILARDLRDANQIQVVFLMVAWFAHLKGESFYRICVLLGLAISYRAYLRTAVSYGKRLAQYMGERILEVQPGGSVAEGARRG